ncbi:MULTISPECIES: DUF2156 domain-containing protein [unclassified Pseudonocardia]|uniref:bifunctional lysylphosphatidylglycerol flippase/synthetase MprF n=1 Tax=unclassified Pseudonocardia TaxID=2619320 RepID=UPI001ACAE864|nr:MULTISPECIES: DUF2156 domain-containing protein [unclassified Pseudonocardia]MBN9098085.1 DUF2156 domain-containing protein [Pseudonocardia sp.]
MSRIGHAGCGFARLVRRAPVTISLVTLLWVIGAATGSIAHGPARALRAVIGAGVPSLAAGHWWTLVSGALWCAGPISYVTASVLLLGLVAPAESRIGSRRTAVLMVVCQAAGSGIGIGVVALTVASGGDWVRRLATDLAVGPSTAAVGVLLATSCRFGPLWRRRVRVVLLGVLMMLTLYSGALHDILRLLGGVTGLLLGPAALGRARRRPRLAVSGPETRMLVALVVAASAIGPLVAAVTGTAIGPLSVLRFLVLPTLPDPAAVAAVCADPANVEDCTSLLYRLRLGGVGPAVMSVLPVLVLLVLADGLRRGRRFAWFAATGLNLGFALLGAALAVVTTSVPAERLVAFGGAADRQFYTGVVTSVVQPLLIVALLVVTRNRFRVRAPAAAYRGPGLLVAAVLLVVSSVYVLGGMLVRDRFAPVPGWADLVADLPTRFLPPGYLGEVEVAFLPTGMAATVLYEWTGVTFWGVALGATLWVLRRTRTVTGDVGAARDLLVRGGGSSLSWQTTWDGNSYWFDAGRRVAIAYRVIGRVAVTSGEPFGDPAARAGAVEGFARFCAEHAWTPCLYSVGDAVRDQAVRLGWDSVQVAEETVVPLADLAFTGKKWQDIRTALNKAGKAGITAEWITYSRAPLVVTDQIRAISEEWVADQGLPEMGFTLGGLDELADDEVHCLIAVDADRTVHGVTSWLPVYESDGGPATVVGWTLDFMRRRDTGDGATAFRGVMEFLIASAALCFQKENARFLSLSGAPLARLDRGGQPDTLQRLLDLSGRALEPVYGFRSLLAFKAKFQPEYRPLHMAYPDAAALPAIGTAIARAYVPDIGVLGSVRLLRRLRQH